MVQKLKDEVHWKRKWEELVARIKSGPI